MLAQIASLVTEAQNSKAPGQRIADKAAQYLVILVVGSGIATFLAWLLLGHSTLLVALAFAISAVVIACPDALGLATPTAVAVGTGLGAKHNILIKDAATLENVSRIQAIVLDKTGTLTEGRPRVTDIVAAPGWKESEVLRLEAGAETQSSHPIGLAVVDEARRLNLQVPTETSKSEVLSGRGIRSTVEGKAVLIGTARLMQENEVVLSLLQGGIDQLLSEGKTLSILAVDGRAAGVKAVADRVKPHAAVAMLKGLLRHYTTLMPIRTYNWC